MLTLLKGLWEVSPKCILVYVLLILVFVTNVFIAEKLDISVIKLIVIVIIQKIVMDTKVKMSTNRKHCPRACSIYM